MSEHSDIRAAIVTRLRSVPGIGVVFDYERYAKTELAFRTLYADPAGVPVLGWHVRRLTRHETYPFGAVNTDWEIRGFMALDDAGASELVFDTLIDGICDAWRADPTLGRVVLYPSDDAPVVPGLMESGPVMFAGVLCHGARLKLTTRHVVEPGPHPWD